jgi:hypothetical protein
LLYRWFKLTPQIGQRTILPQNADAVRRLRLFRIFHHYLGNAASAPVGLPELLIPGLLRNNTIIIENLANLERLPCDQCIFSCFPLSFTDADGSPVRAVAFI